jgi:hypothetical protein
MVGCGGGGAGAAGRNPRTLSWEWGGVEAQGKGVTATETAHRLVAFYTGDGRHEWAGRSGVLGPIYMMRRLPGGRSSDGPTITLRKTMGPVSRRHQQTIHTVKKQIRYEKNLA